MPEESTGAGAPQEQSTEGQQPDAGASTEPTQPTPAAAESGQPSANQLIKQFAKEQGISVEDLLDSYKQLKSATQTESERLEGERDRYRTEAERLGSENRELRAESTFLKAAGEAGALDAETLFMAYKARLDYDKTGKATNIAEVVKDLKAEKPHMFRPVAGTSDAGRKGDGMGDENDINAQIRRKAGRR